MKKVLVVASVISFIEWFNKENIDFLKKDMGCEVHIACNFEYMHDTDEERTIAYINKLKSDGIILHNINFARNPLNPENLSAYKKLKKIINSNNFDLIHCHTPAAAMITRLAAIKSRKKGSTVMYSCHGFHFHNSAPKLNWLIYYPIERFLSHFCDYIVTINKEDFERSKTFHAKNTRLIPGVGVDINLIKNTVVDKPAFKESLGIPANAIMLLSLGELIERKNHQVIIKALGELNREDIYYAICGKGPLLQELKTLAEKSGVADKVLFLGFRTDIPELCCSADISAFPSRIEGLGIAGIEAMSAGVPLVSSNVHGILDYVKDGVTGYACHPEDYKAFAKAIDKLASNKNLREEMRDACIKAAEPFELSNALNVMWDIYREILMN